MPRCMRRPSPTAHHSDEPIAMATYVLVHGACHDGSAWTSVIERLEDRGHTAFAPTVAGHGPGANRRVTRAESTKSVVDFMGQRNLTNAILAGPQLRRQRCQQGRRGDPDRVRRLWSAFVLNDGESMLEVYPPALQEMRTRASVGGDARPRSVVHQSSRTCGQHHRGWE